MLCILGDVNRIEVAANHADAMKCLAEVWDKLEQVSLTTLIIPDFFLLISIG